APSRPPGNAGWPEGAARPIRPIRGASWEEISGEGFETAKYIARRTTPTANDAKTPAITASRRPFHGTASGAFTGAVVPRAERRARLGPAWRNHYGSDAPTAHSPRT